MTSSTKATIATLRLAMQQDFCALLVEVGGDETPQPEDADLARIIDRLYGLGDEVAMGNFVAALNLWIGKRLPAHYGAYAAAYRPE